MYKDYPMDNLVYTYPRDGNGTLTRNWLNQVKDNVTNESYTNDISGANNYLYDNIGNLKQDATNGICARNRGLEILEKYGHMSVVKRGWKPKNAF